MRSAARLNLTPTHKPPQVLHFLMDRSEANAARHRVGLDEWARFLYRLGPLDACVGKATASFFTPQGEMVPWFHGPVSRQCAKELLLGEGGGSGGGRPGSFLVRFSESNPKNFTLTYLDEAEFAAALAAGTEPPRYKNVLVHNRGPWGFALAPEGPRAACYATLKELVDCRQGWSVPCPSALAAQFNHNTATAAGGDPQQRAPPLPLLPRSGSSSGSLRRPGAVREEASGSTTPDALRALSPPSFQEAAAGLTVPLGTPGSSGGSAATHEGTRRRSGSGSSSSLGVGDADGARRVALLGRSHTSAPGGAGVAATPPMGPSGWGRSVSVKPGNGGGGGLGGSSGDHPLLPPVGGPLRAQSLMLPGGGGRHHHHHHLHKGQQPLQPLLPPPRFGRGGSSGGGGDLLPERAPSFSSSISEEGVGPSLNRLNSSGGGALLPRDESTVILDSDMDGSSASSSGDEGPAAGGGGGRRRPGGSRKLRSGGNGGVVGGGGGGGFGGLMDSPVFSPGMEGVSVSMGGIGEEQDEEGEEGGDDGGGLVGGRGRLPVEVVGGYDSHVSSRASSPEHMLGHGGRRRRRRRGHGGRRRRSGSSVGGLETEEEEGSGDVDVDVEEEQDEEEDDGEEDELEEGIPEPSEAEMRRRLTLLHTMSSVGSVDEAARLLERAMVVVAGGRYEEALGLLDEALGVAGAETCERAEALVQVQAAKVKGTVFLEMGLPREASLWFELCARAGLRVLQLTPADEDLGEQFPFLRYAHKHLAQCYLAAQAYSLVVEHFEHLVALTDDPGERRLLFRDFERLSLEFDFWRVGVCGCAGVWWTASVGKR